MSSSDQETPGYLLDQMTDCEDVIVGIHNARSALAARKTVVYTFCANKCGHNSSHDGMFCSVDCRNDYYNRESLIKRTRG